MIAIAVALKDEVKDFLRIHRFRRTGQDHFPRFYQSSFLPDVVLIQSGAGRRYAQEATQTAIALYSPSLIITAGFSGGVAKGLNAGDIFVCNRLYAPPETTIGEDVAAASNTLDIDNGLLEISEMTLQAAGQIAHIRASLTIESIVESSATKEWIGNNYPVDIVDMESYWVAQTAKESSVPVLAVRCVLDAREVSLPSFVKDAVEAQGKNNWTRALRYVMSHPQDISRLVSLGRKASIAQRSLSAALSAIIAQLPLKVGKAASLS